MFLCWVRLLKLALLAIQSLKKVRTVIMTNRLFSSYQEEHQNTPFYWFLWDEELPPTARVQLAREKLNFHNGLTFVR